MSSHFNFIPTCELILVYSLFVAEEALLVIDWDLRRVSLTVTPCNALQFLLVDLLGSVKKYNFKSKCNYTYIADDDSIWLSCNWIRKMELIRKHWGHSYEWFEWCDLPCHLLVLWAKLSHIDENFANLRVLAERLLTVCSTWTAFLCRQILLFLPLAHWRFHYLFGSNIKLYFSIFR